jgi:hypothetical protein
MKRKSILKNSERDIDRKAGPFPASLQLRSPDLIAIAIISMIPGPTGVLAKEVGDMVT